MYSIAHLRTELSEINAAINSFGDMSYTEYNAMSAMYKAKFDDLLYAKEIIERDLDTMQAMQDDYLE